MKKWSFVINGNYTNFIRNIVKDEIGNDIFFYEEGEEEEGSLTYFFSSSHLNHLDNPDDVFENGMWLKTIFDGISFLIHEDKTAYYPIELGTIINNETGKLIPVKYRTQQLPFNIDFSINNIDRKDQTPGLADYFEQATKNQFLLNIALICSNGMSYRDLYQALDETKYFLKMEKGSILNHGASKSEITRFTHTANNFTAVGIHARHGRSSQKPPKNPMKLVEAQKLISNLIYNVLEKHLNIKLIEIKSVNIDLDTTDWDLDDQF